MPLALETAGRTSKGVRVIQENFESVESGLCGDCEHASTCTFPRPRRVFQCDEFCYRVPAEVKRQTGNPAHNPGHNPEGNPSDASVSENKRLGLCRSCAGWKTCAYGCPEGGIWHCDEYH
jgi:hypothetical protein